MRDLILFLQKFKFFILFAILQVFSIYLYINNYHYPSTKFFSSANSISAGMLETGDNIYKFFNTPQANRTLQEENSKLRAENERLSKLLDTTKFQDTTLNNQLFEYIPARVIYTTYGDRNNYITINRGKNDGINDGMGVFTDKGIIGIVHHSTERYSVIKSVLSSKIYIDVRIEKGNIPGLLNWDGKSAKFGKVDAVSSDYPIKKWSKIVTGGEGGVFPSGLYVGKISDFYLEETRPNWNITIKYDEDFKRLTNVYVIKNIRKNEIDELTEVVKEELERQK